MNTQGTYQRPVDFNAHVQNSVILNDMLLEENEVGEKTINTRKLLNLIKVEYEGDHISTIPSCFCGHYNKPDKRHYTCPKCNTVCTVITNHPIKSDLFIRPPKGVIAFIRPAFYTMLSKFFVFSKQNVIAYLINRNEKLVAKSHYIENLLKARGIERGYNFFIENFDYIVQTLLDLKLHRNVNKTVKLDFQKWIADYRNDFFVDYLPIPSKVTFVTEVTPLGKYVDGTMNDALDSICSILNIDEGPYGTFLNVKENRTAKTVIQLANFYYDYTRTHINPKEGIARQHTFGTLTDFTGYCVISSKTRNVDPEAVTTPWSYTVGILKMHIQSWIINNNPGMNARQIEQIVVAAVSKYDPFIHDVINKLIEQTPYKGIPCLILRNPSLDKLSLQCMYITAVKTDLRDRTLDIPITNTKGWNADFDGDNMALKLIEDHLLFDYLRALEPGYSYWDLQQLRKIRSVNDYHSPFLTTVNNFLYWDKRVAADGHH